MTTLEYIIWLVATAVMTLTLLTVGTLAAAGMVLKPPVRGSRPVPERQP